MFGLISIHASEGESCTDNVFSSQCDCLRIVYSISTISHVNWSVFVCADVDLPGSSFACPSPSPPCPTSPSPPLPPTSPMQWPVTLSSGPHGVGCL